jgi:phage gpG-like protein
MPSGGVRITGLNKVVKGLQELGLDLDDLKDAFGQLANQGARIAAQYVQSRTGRLAGSVRGNRAKNKAVIAAGRAKVKYAGVQNYGWPRKNVAAQQFMQKADDVLKPIAVTELERAINKSIERRGL